MKILFDCREDYDPEEKDMRKDSRQIRREGGLWRSMFRCIPLLR